MRFLRSAHCAHDASAAIGDQAGRFYAVQGEKLVGSDLVSKES